MAAKVAVPLSLGGIALIAEHQGTRFVEATVERNYTSFREFYPDYLAEHQNSVSRRLHFVGTLMVILTLILALVTRRWTLLILMPVFGYGFAWVGHYMFERNRPATFKHPLYSLSGDFVMFRDILMGKSRFRKREEGRGKREEGRGKREEGRGKREAGRGKREAGRGKREREAGRGKREEETTREAQ